MTDLRIQNEAFQKKQKSYFAIRLDEGVEANELALGNGNHQLADLPPDAIITDSYIHVITVNDAATTKVATLGTASGGSEILSAADLKSAGKEGTFTGDSLTGTGVTIWLGITVVGAETAVGEYFIVIEYMEPEKKTGEYTTIPTI